MSFFVPHFFIGSVKFTTCFMFKNLDSKGDSNKKSIDLPF